MGLSQDEKNKLQVFSNMPLNRIQTETIIGRKLTDAEWESRNHDYLTNAERKSRNKDYRKIFTPIARQAANTALKRQRLKASENKFKIVAHQAAKVGARKQLKAAKESDDKFHLCKNCFEIEQIITEYLPLETMRKSIEKNY